MSSETVLLHERLAETGIEVQFRLTHEENTHYRLARGLITEQEATGALGQEPDEFTLARMNRLIAHLSLF